MKYYGKKEVELKDLERSKEGRDKIITAEDMIIYVDKP